MVRMMMILHQLYDGRTQNDTNEYRINECHYLIFNHTTELESLMYDSMQKTFFAKHAKRILQVYLLLLASLDV